MEQQRCFLFVVLFEVANSFWTTSRGGQSLLWRHCQSEMMVVDLVSSASLCRESSVDVEEVDH